MSNQSTSLNIAGRSRGTASSLVSKASGRKTSTPQLSAGRNSNSRILSPSAGRKTTMARRQTGRVFARPFRISSHKRRRARSTPQYGMPKDTSKTEGQTTLTSANKDGSMTINAANKTATKTSDKANIFSRVISALQGIFGDSHTQNEAAKNFASIFVPDKAKEESKTVDFTGSIGPRPKNLALQKAA